MTIPEAIEIAEAVSGKLYHEYDVHYFCDPSFWQALGKALGWNEEKDYAGETSGDGKWHQTYTINSWVSEWHRFIDHLAEGNTAESFFESLK